MNLPDPREESIFDGACGLSGVDRAAYLDKVCAGRPELRERIEGLLAALKDAPGLMQEPAVSREQVTRFVALPPSGQPGDCIGGYKLLQQIGEGGCGVVYLAEQTAPVKRRVALKILKLGLDTKQVIARFEAERQALALMDHPNIAKVFDAGATDTGRPYFVMELVRGIRITDYCDENELPMKQRLELLVQVCQAIQHAHQKGIIHRDIKPSNILVSVNDGVAVPKVIDFGIAKATTGLTLTDKTLVTAFEQFIGTPAYMSPEQAMLTSLDIDTRTDIYSLGVLLYELLTGQTPFDTKQLLRAGFDEMRRTICENDPARPSTRLSALGKGELTTTAKRRHTKPPELIHLVRGDLDWIVMKAMEKNRSRRYETANGLAMDLRRHLNCEPVVARPPSRFYYFRKAIRRHRVGFAAGAAILAVLAMAVVLSTVQAIRLAQAKRQTETINRFLTEDVLYQATPDQNPRQRKISIEEALQFAAKKLDENPSIAREPELEAALRQSVGNTCFKLGLLEEAERHLRRALLLRQKTLGPEHPQTLTSKQEWADLLNNGLRDFAGSEVLSRETWTARRKVLGANHPQTLESLHVYAETLIQQRKLDLAEPLTRQCLQARELVLGPDNPATLDTLVDLGLLLTFRGDFKEAEQMFRRVIEKRERAGLGNMTDTFTARYDLALALLLEGRANDAEKLMGDLLERARGFFGPEHPHSLHIQQALVRAMLDAGHLEKAEALARETLEIRRRVTPKAEGMARTLLYFGAVLTQQGKVDAAEPLLNEALELFREKFTQLPELQAWAANSLGAIQLARKALPQAEQLMLPNAELILSTPLLAPAERRQAIRHLVALYRQWENHDKAAFWEQKLDALMRTGDNPGP